MQERERYIDILRAFGLLSIIYVHVLFIPKCLLELNTFNVPLMIFVSGLCVPIELPNLKEFYIKRIMRLIIPVWLFLSVYLIFLSILYNYGICLYYLTPTMVWRSYMLLDGIGFVWVIRIFLLMMLVTPMILKLNKLIKNDIIFSVLLFCLILLQSWLCSLEHILPSSVREFYNLYVLYLFGYIPILWLGIRLRRASTKSWMTICSFVVLATIIMLLYHHKLNIMDFKYPPRLYYIAYGLGMCVLLWMGKFLCTKVLEPLWKVLAWIGKNTLWIYLWHIPIVTIMNHIANNYGLIILSGCGNYMVVSCLTLFIYYIQWMICSRNKKGFTKYLIG